MATLPDAGTAQELSHIGNPSRHVAVDLSSTDFDITASSLGRACVALYVGTSSSGNVTVKDSKGTAVTYKNVPQGSYLPGVFTVVVKSTTTASDIVAVGI